MPIRAKEVLIVLSVDYAIIIPISRGKEVKIIMIRIEKSQTGKDLEGVADVNYTVDIETMSRFRTDEHAASYKTQGLRSGGRWLVLKRKIAGNGDFFT